MKYILYINIIFQILYILCLIANFVVTNEIKVELKLSFRFHNRLNAEM